MEISKDLYRWSRYRARQKGIPFEIELVDIIVPNYCPITGMKLEKNESHSGLNSPTLDRFDNDKGYIKGNVQVISNLANLMKSKATPSQLQDFATWIKNNHSTT